MENDHDRADGASAPIGADPARTTPERTSRVAVLAQAALALIVLAAGAAAAFWVYTDEPSVPRAEAPPERAAPLVRTVRMEPAPRHVEVTAWGEVQPSRKVTLGPRVGGYVTEVAERFTPGTVLEKGDLLVQLDREPYELALQRARTELTQAQSDLALEQGQRAVAEQALALGEEPGSERERALMLREPQLAAARAAVEAARVSVAEAERELAQTAVRAPFDALVLERQVAVGAEVGSSSELATLVGVDRWWVELAVPVDSLRWIEFPGESSGEAAAGSTVRIHLQGEGDADAVVTGEVARLRGDLAEEGRMARVLVRIDDPFGRESGGAHNPAGRVLLGAFVRGEIEGTQVNRAYALEPEWLRGDDEAWLLAVDGTLEVRKLDIAHRDGQRALVTGGLQPGDRLITSRLAMPAPGMALRTVHEAPVRQAKTGPEATADDG